MPRRDQSQPPSTVPIRSLSQAQNSLQLIAETALQRDEEFQRYADASSGHDSYKENDSPSPVFHAFYESGGTSLIKSTSNFVEVEFDHIWTTCAAATGVC